ncbi:MAG: hypothetical protein GY853_08495 [PVC group bacterium]|nr:hypothetical protein [PVC group bacterium]
MDKIKKSQWSLIRESWLSAMTIIKSDYRIMLPYAVLAFLELSAIIILFFAIQPPLVKYFTPIIMRFAGRQFFHYPYNLLLLAKGFSHIQVVLSIILGTFIAGVTINLVQQKISSKVISLKAALKRSLVSYIHLFLITLIVFFLIKGAFWVESKVLLKIMMKGRVFLNIRREGWMLIFTAINIITMGFLQSLFIFAHPVIIIEGKNFIVALFRNVGYIFKNFLAVIILVLVPLLLYLPVALLKTRLFPLMENIVPEIVFLVLIAGICMSFLVNVFITVSTTKLYLLIRGEGN